MSSEYLSAKVMSTAFSKAILNDFLKFGKSKKFDQIIHSIPNLNIENKSNGDLFNLFYTKMIKEYRNEYIYKNAIANKIVLGRHKYKNISFFTEMFVWGVIADIVVANGTTSVYEIKTHYDSFFRLNSQIEVYEKAFENVNIVIPESKLNNLLKIIPDNIGVIILSENFTLQEYRKPLSNFDNLSNEIMISLISSNDKKLILKKYYDIKFEYNCLEDYSKEKKLLLDLNKNIIHAELIQSMHKREYDQQRKDLVLKSPESLRSLLMSANYSKPMMKSITDLLEQKYN